MNKIACERRLSILHLNIIDATRDISLGDKVESMFCIIRNVLIILKYLSIEDLSFKFVIK